MIVWLYVFIGLFGLISLACFGFAIIHRDIFLLGMGMLALTITLLALSETGWWHEFESRWQKDEE